MRIAHLSDLHLLSLDGAVPFRLLNKRLTGYLNLRFHRKSVHKPFAVHAAAREVVRLGIDHVVITGDLSNLALEGEFELVRRFPEGGATGPAGTRKTKVKGFPFTVVYRDEPNEIIVFAIAPDRQQAG